MRTFFHLAAIIVVSVSSMAVDQPLTKETQLAEINPKLFGIVTDFYNMIIAEPINTFASAIAAMAAQLAAGIALNGIGKRDLSELSHFVEQVQSAFLALLNQINQNLNAISIQILEHFPLQRGFFDDLANSLSGAIYEIGNQLVQQGGMAITQWLINFSQGNQQGKRDVYGIFDNFVSTITNGLYDLANTAVQQAGMALTQWLINFANGNNAQGKRELTKGFFDDLANSITGALYEVGNQLVQQGGMAITQWLINFSQGNQQGKRFLADTISNFGNAIYNMVDNLVQTTAFQVAQILVNISENGILPIIGKRAKDNMSVDAFVHQLLTLINELQNHINSGSGSNLIGK